MEWNWSQYQVTYIYRPKEENGIRKRKRIFPIFLSRNCLTEIFYNYSAELCMLPSCTIAANSIIIYIEWYALPKMFNPFALRKAITVCNFGLSECNRVKGAADIFLYTLLLYIPRSMAHKFDRQSHSFAAFWIGSNFTTTRILLELMPWLHIIPWKEFGNFRTFWTRGILKVYKIS